MSKINRMLLLKSVYRQDFKYIIIIVLLGLHLSTPLMRPEFFASHESDRVQYRVQGIIQAWESGQVPAKVLPNLCNGYGYGFNIFYSPLSYSTTAAIAVLLGGKIQFSIKIWICLCFIFSGLAMYWFGKSVQYGRGDIAVLGAILYMYAPYRLVDAYLRNAYAESTTFVFLPLVALGFYRLLFSQEHNWLLLSISLSLMMLTHNITALFTIIFLILSGIILIPFITLNKHILQGVVKAAILCFCLTAYFILPLAQHKYQGDYAVFSGMMGSPDLLREHSLYVGQLFTGNDILTGESISRGKTAGEMPFIIGFPLIAIGIGCFLNVGNRACRFWFGMAVIALFMTTKYFPWSAMPEFVGFLQFPWRLFIFAIFFLSVCALYFYGKYIKNMEKTNSSFVLTILIMIIVLSCQNMLNSVKYHSYGHDFTIEKYDDEVPGSIGTTAGEYLPLKLYRNKKYLVQREAPISSIGKNDIEFDMITNNNGILEFNVTHCQKPTQIELPFIYYLGYQARLRTDSGNDERLEISESDNGFCSVNIPTNGTVHVYYGKTSLDVIGIVLTAAGILFCIINRSFAKYRLNRQSALCKNRKRPVPQSF